MVNVEIAVPEEHDVGRGLARDPLADRAVAGVVVDRLPVGMRVDVLATSSVLV
jgi:hypothetical protein